MKKIIIIISVLMLAVGCKKELVPKPEGLVEREKMIDIMYDLSLLEAIKYQNPMSLDSSDTNPTRFILKKYKVDSLQFVKSNMYYAANYNDYKDMFDQISARIEKNKKKVDSLIKIEEKKKKLLEKKGKVVKKDSIEIKVKLKADDSEQINNPDSIKGKQKLKLK
ncbi:DUF4296 domain-containing protein [Flavobacterium hydatis]|uniref:DUF4296 domain-containing protein n=1 Tax=Flavobacterium hydatis TaxID=991 RepID=A0A086AU79_FLAHY|nr:DUF4296 domain-containing protein [Flavobacterium hydatis]KFF20243.1 hypothetical protein IW20_00345 [Flavobacterium hydatis]OXA98465.1 hypothetical protein B0A62_01305 [Flavobacterium hydatis]